MLSDVVRLPHRLRQQGLWGLGPDVFIANLASLGLDPRTERSLREAIESYRRGVISSSRRARSAASARSSARTAFSPPTCDSLPLTLWPVSVKIQVRSRSNALLLGAQFPLPHEDLQPALLPRSHHWRGGGGGAYAPIVAPGKQAVSKPRGHTLDTSRPAVLLRRAATGMQQTPLIAIAVGLPAVVMIAAGG